MNTVELKSYIEEINALKSEIIDELYDSSALSEFLQEMEKEFKIPKKEILEQSIILLYNSEKNKNSPENSKILYIIKKIMGKRQELLRQKFQKEKEIKKFFIISNKDFLSEEKISYIKFTLRTDILKCFLNEIKTEQKIEKLKRIGLITGILGISGISILKYFNSNKSKTKESKTKESKTKESKTKESKTKESKTKESKTKESKTKESKSKRFKKNLK